MSQLDLKISEIYGVSLSDTGSMKSSQAACPGVGISLCIHTVLIHPHSDPAILVTATNGQVKHSVELGVSRSALFIVQPRKERVVNIVYMLSLYTYSCKPLMLRLSSRQQAVQINTKAQARKGKTL